MEKQDDAENSDFSSTSEELIDTDDSSDTIGDAEEFSKGLLNFGSPTFNPRLALLCSTNSSSDANAMTGPPLPNPAAPKYLNLVQYKKAVHSPSKTPKKEFQLSKPVIGKKNVIQQQQSKSSEEQGGIKYPIPGRKFLPHQLPTFQPRMEAPNTVDVMANIEGPLGALRQAMEEKRKIKVWTRNDTGIRGYVTGYVVVFDKHWNLGLRDVDENFQRKRRLKYPAKDPSPSQITRPKPKPLLRRKLHRKSKTDASSIAPVNSTLMSGSSESLMNVCRKGLQSLSISDGASTSSNLLENKSTAELPTKSQIRKKGLKVFKHPFRDPNGFLIVAQSQKYEIVERHVGQLFVMGNDIVFIETMFNS